MAVSPSLGGEILVSFQHLKKWNSILAHEEEFLETDFSPLESDPMEVSEGEDDVKDVTSEPPPENLDPQNVMDIPKNSEVSQNDVLPQGYYMVESILKHKFEQGWKFLTKWENFPVSSSTWEAPRAFKLGKNLWNEVFIQYCTQNGLQVTPSGHIKVMDLPEKPPLHTNG